MRRLSSSWILAALLVAACNPHYTGIPANGKRPQGQTSFETPLGNNQASREGGYSDSNTAATPGASDGKTAAAAPAAQPTRTVEESDIYKLDGNNLFVLNEYRGLEVLDLTNLDAPKLIGRAPIFGYPKDMYVRDGFAYVIVSDYWTYWRDAVVDDVYPFWGSQLRIIDVRDPKSPKIVGAIDLEGDCGDSRIVGNVMYLVSHRYSWWYNAGSTDSVDRTTVVSVSIADVNNIHVVDTVDFPRNGWDHHVYVDTQAIYLAASEYSYDGGNETYSTTLRYIDISDPDGAIVLRGTAAVDGMVQDRWSMDVYNQVLRVASGSWWNGTSVHLTTFDVTNPDAISQLGQVSLNTTESLQSARFDGKRGYLVTYRHVDPLFAFDLSDPKNPVQLGELQMTGWLDFMVPAGDRVVALGHDSVTLPDGSTSNWSLAVSLIDVGTNQPALLSRVPIDGAYGWLPSSADDFAKVFKTLPEINLVIFPFQAWSPTDWKYVGGVQLIDYFHDTLVKRGTIGNAGWVERGVVDGQDTVLTISSEIFQVMNIADRDNPVLRGRLELARNVTDFALLGNGYTAQLGGDWYMGDTNLTITTVADPDTTEPVASIHVPAPYGRLFVNGNYAYITSVMQTQATATTPYSATTHIQVIDLTDPSKPVERGSLDLPEAVWGSYGYWYWGWGDEVVQVSGSVLAFHHYGYYWYGEDCAGCRGGSGYDDKHRIYFVDLKDPNAPRLASTVELPNLAWAWGLRAQGNSVLISSYDSIQRNGQWFALYDLQRVDLADVNNPVVEPPVSIPGWLVGVSEQGDYIYTLETWWDDAAQTSHTTLNALELFSGYAYLQSSTSVDNYLSNLVVDKDGAFGVVYKYWTDTNAQGNQQWHSQESLVSFDLSDPTNIYAAGSTKIPDTWGWLRKVEGGRAFITGGAGIFVYDVKDITKPSFNQFFRTNGWVENLVLSGNTVYLPSGYYGVQVANLNAVP